MTVPAMARAPCRIFILEGIMGSRRGVLLAVAVALCLIGLPECVKAADVNWQRFNVNKDKFFDQADKDIIFKGGVWNSTIDVNGDGRKDIADAFALLLLATSWDRNADLAVSADDFTPLPSINLPEPDAIGARTLAIKCRQEMMGKVPVDLEDKLKREWAPLSIINAPDEGALYEESGAVALSQHNLEVAQWAYAKACELAPARDSVYSNLAFTLSQRGRYHDAMVLLAYARKLQPKSGVTSNNIGWIFARNGQLALARQYYQEAIGLLPDVAQYHINLGVVLLRMENPAGARAEFDRAAKLNPNDRDSLFLSLATNPPAPAKLAEAQAQYEKNRDENNKTAGEEEKMAPWDELDVEAKINEIISQAVERVSREKDAALKELTEQTKQRIQQAVEPAAPKGNDAREDFKRWKENGQSAYDKVQQVCGDGNLRATELATEFKRKQGAAILETGPQVLQLALTEAQKDMAGYTDAKQARQAFERTVDNLYTREMAYAQEQMVKGRDTAYLDLRPDQQDATMLTMAGFMPIVARAASDKDYGKDFLGKKDDFPTLNAKIKTPGLDEPAFGLSLGVVGVEWNSQSNEFKLQAGQGLIAAGTWSPTSGFGFQLGIGVSITQGPIKVKAGNFIKFGSDGSINVDYKGGATVGAGPVSAGWTDSITVPVRAAMYEPVGTLK
jgi:Tfp pilus assembly protein PilF